MVDWYFFSRLDFSQFNEGVMSKKIYALMQTKSCKKHWVEFIGEMQPEFFLTLTFIRPLSDSDATKAVGHFLRMLLACAPRKTKKNITGVISAERSRNSNLHLGHYHFHIVLKGLKADLLTPLLWLSKAAIKCANKLRTLAGISLCNTSNVDVQEVYDAAGLARYLTKDVRYPFDSLATNVWLFDFKGIAGMLPDAKA